MGVNYNPKIVTDQLTTFLDAGNEKSYSGSGSTVYDLSGNGNNGTILSTASFSNDSGVKSFLFDANGEIITAPAATSGSYNRTWENVHKRSSSINTYNMFMGVWSPYFGLRSGGFYHFSCLIGGTQRSIYSPSGELSNGIWYHSTFTTEYDGTNTTLKIYINGVEKGSGTWAGAPSLSTTLSVGEGRTTTWYPFRGNIAVSRVYNKTLSLQEIKQNFNATRGRYGI